MIEFIEYKVDMGVHFGQGRDYSFISEIDEKHLARAIVTYSIVWAISRPLCNVKATGWNIESQN